MAEFLLARLSFSSSLGSGDPRHRASGWLILLGRRGLFLDLFARFHTRTRLGALRSA